MQKSRGECSAGRTDATVLGLHKWVHSLNSNTYWELHVCLPLSESDHVDYLIKLLQTPGWSGECLIIYYIWQLRKLRLRDMVTHPRLHSWQVEELGLEPIAVNQHKSHHIGAWDATLLWAIVSFTLWPPSFHLYKGVSYSCSSRSLAPRQRVLRMARLENTNFGSQLNSNFWWITNNFYYEYDPKMNKHKYATNPCMNFRLHTTSPIIHYVTPLGTFYNLFIHPKLHSPHCVSGLVLGSGDTSLHKADQSLCPHGV